VRNLISTSPSGSSTPPRAAGSAYISMCVGLIWGAGGGAGGGAGVGGMGVRGAGAERGLLCRRGGCKAQSRRKGAPPEAGHTAPHLGVDHDPRAAAQLAAARDVDKHGLVVDAQLLHDEGAGLGVGRGWVKGAGVRRPLQVAKAVWG
jgi:hypothetical protein